MEDLQTCLCRLPLQPSGTPSFELRASVPITVLGAIMSFLAAKCDHFYSVRNTVGALSSGASPQILWWNLPLEFRSGSFIAWGWWAPTKFCPVNSTWHLTWQSGLQPPLQFKPTESPSWKTDNQCSDIFIQWLAAVGLLWFALQPQFSCFSVLPWILSAFNSSRLLLLLLVGICMGFPVTQAVTELHSLDHAHSTIVAEAISH